MAYFAPYIDETGLHIPTYSDILNDLLDNARSIFGQDIYLGPDSQDYQAISSFALKVNDTLQAIQFAYDSRGPSTAIGAGLDVVVALNGIRRNPPANSSSAYSVCPVTLTGEPGTQIDNGLVQDISGYYWALPSVVTIGSSGSIDVSATCQTAGPVAAGPGDISIIATPTYGWTSVINAASATLGTAIESDSKLRARQAISTAQPSRSILEGTKGAIASVAGVTRSQVYENDTSATDSNGLPAHSITAVVEGGTDSDIAQALFLKKGPGCYTNGTTQVDITDSFGQVIPIRFYRPTYDDIDATINIKALAGFKTQNITDIKNAVANFLNSNSIGQDLAISSLWGAALSVLTNLNSPIFSITSIIAAKHGNVQDTNDIAIAFNEVTRGNVANITVNVS